MLYSYKRFLFMMKQTINHILTFVCLQEKLENQQSTNHKTISELEDKLASVTAFKDELQK